MSSHIFHGFWHLCAILTIDGSSMLIFSCQALLASTLNFQWLFSLAERTASSAIRWSMSKGKRDMGIFNTYIYRSGISAVKKCLCQYLSLIIREAHKCYVIHGSLIFLSPASMIYICADQLTQGVKCYQDDWYSKQGLNVHKIQKQ